MGLAAGFEGSCLELEGRGVILSVWWIAIVCPDPPLCIRREGFGNGDIQGSTLHGFSLRGHRLKETRLSMVHAACTGCNKDDTLAVHLHVQQPTEWKYHGCGCLK